VRVSDRQAYDPNARGYHATYREGEVNHCPGCGRTQWHIGRTTAECAFCSTPVPLDQSFSRDDDGGSVIMKRGKGGGKVR
jgi:hypothetical protein